ncbi:MAG: hypothetical protein EOM37_01985 [Proteobacteria bacterium]|nr:hypothetical protein [Alphaproteobacteria bacterium]NCC02805.1 hypothetical protein [Pseudomonadota bacterium]
MSRKFALISLLFLLISTAFPVNAATPKPTVRPVLESDGSFGFCLAEQSYPDGRKLTIAASPAKQINLGFTIPKGGFKKGNRYDLTLKTGDGKPRAVRAFALDETTLLLQMGADARFKKKLIESNTIEIGKSGKFVSYTLPAMAPLFDSINDCLAQKGKGSTQARPAIREKGVMPITEGLMALLSLAGFENIQPLDMSEIPEAERPADYVWRTGNLMAGVRERDAPKDVSLSDLVGLHLQGLKEKCSGTYSADIDKEKNSNGVKLRKAFATCAPGKGQSGESITVAMILYTTPKGNFTVFTHEAQSTHAQEAIAARDQLARTILDISAKR